MRAPGSRTGLRRARRSDRLSRRESAESQRHARTGSSRRSARQRLRAARLSSVRRPGRSGSDATHVCLTTSSRQTGSNGHDGAVEP